MNGNWKVGISVVFSVRGLVVNSVRYSIGDSVADSVRGSVLNSVWGPVYNSVRDSVITEPVWEDINE